MPKAQIPFGNASAGSSSPATAEDAAAEYFTSRLLMGVLASKPPIKRWRPDLRERFLTELRRLEEETRSDAELAGLQGARRPVGEAS